MSVKKKSLVLHLDALEVIEELNLEQRGKLLTAIFQYNKGEHPELDQLLKIVFLPFKNQFDRDLEKYLKVCKINKEIADGRVKKKKEKYEPGRIVTERINSEPEIIEPLPEEIKNTVTDNLEKEIKLPLISDSDKDNKKETENTVKVKMDEKWFLSLFNNLKKEKKPLSTGTKTLTSTSKSNLKKLIAAGYTPEDFEGAIKEMLKSKWVSDTSNDTPEHVLRENNFQRYSNKANEQKGGDFKQAKNGDPEFL